MDPSLTYNAFGHTYDDEDLKKDSKIRKTKSTVRLRKRKKLPPRRSNTTLTAKHVKLPSIIQEQTVKERAITPQVPSPSSAHSKTSGKTTQPSTRRNTINSSEFGRESDLVLPDIHKPRAQSAAAAAPISQEPTEQQTDSAEEGAAMSGAEEKAAKEEEAKEEAPQKATLTETASATVEPPAPKKEEGFKLNFKFDFTKVNFKKKAQEQEKKKEEEAKMLKAVREAEAREAAIKAAKKLAAIRDEKNKTAADQDGKEAGNSCRVSLDEEDDEEWSDEFSDEEQEKEIDDGEANKNKAVDKDTAIEDAHATVVGESVEDAHASVSESVEDEHATVASDSVEKQSSAIKAVQENTATHNAIDEEEEEDSGYSDAFDSYESDFESDSDDA